MEAKIADTFISYQGEGPYLGARQLFIRFYGCSLDCIYCDTKPLSYATFTKEALLNKVMQYKDAYHSMSLTGGEPLEQSDFLREFLIMYKSAIQKSVYLETNGILYKEIMKIIDFIDIIAMDIKLPSSTGRDAFWEEHRKFLELTKSKNIFIKVIIQEKTELEDLIKAKDIVKGLNRKIPFILQPVDPVNSVKEVSSDGLAIFKDKLDKELEDVRIIPQHHKVAGIK